MTIDDHTIQPIGLVGLKGSSGADGFSELLKDFDSGFPADAGVCDADAFLELGGSFGGDFLVAFVDVGFDHHADNGGFAFADLIPNDLGDFGLVAVVLVGVA